VNLQPLQAPPQIHTSPPPRTLDLRGVHLYLCDLDAEARSDRWDGSVLSAEEVKRADRLSCDPHRRRFATGRTILRCLLGSVLGMDPREIAFEKNVFGKPRLAESCGRRGGTDAGILHFNCSHREHVLMVGLTPLGELGVDVELVRPGADVERLAADYFPPAQAQALRELPPARALREFYRAWTLREALIKAAGSCIALGLDGLAGRPGDRCASCRALNATPPATGSFLYYQFDVSVGGADATASIALADSRT